MITAPIPQSFRFRPIDSEMPNFDNTFDADDTARHRMIIPWKQYVALTDIQIQVNRYDDNEGFPTMYILCEGNEFIVGDSSTITVGSYVYTTFIIQPSGFAGKICQLKIVEIINGIDPIITHISEPFIVQSQPTFLKLQWYNSENAYLMDYSSDTFIHELWLDAELESSPFSGEMSIYSNQGSLVKLKEVSNRVFKITVEVPAYIAEIITLATAHDRFYVNEIQYTVEKKPDINRIGQSNLYRIEFEMIQSVATGINKHDAG